jgi:hypothetical protein
MAKKPTAERVPSERWDRSHGEYLTGRSHLDGVDALAADMERHWGCDRLRLLVGQELRERFDRQRYLFAQAITSGRLEDLVRECGRMERAWRALDAAAKASGAQPLPLEVWEVTLENNTVAAIVRDAEQARMVLAQGRQMVVYTLAEIGRLLAVYPDIVKVKQRWPGAAVSRVRDISDPLEGINAPTGLETPLDDPIPSW